MLRAIFLSPLVLSVPILISYWVSIVFAGFEGGLNSGLRAAFSENLTIAALFAVASVFAAYIGLIFYGLPMFYFLKSKNCCTLSMLLGAAVAPWFILAIIWSITEASFSLEIVFGALGPAICSIAVAFVFWRLVPRA